MKIILIVLISFSFCEILYLEKYGTIKVNNSKGTICLNVEKFKIGDTIHIQLDTVNGKMSDIIYYEFKNKIPDEIINLAYSMTTTFFSETRLNIGKKSITKNYFYDIKKNVNLNYLIIKYADATGDYIKIENTRINWGYMRVIFLILIFVVVISIIIVSFMRVIH